MLHSLLADQIEPDNADRATPQASILISLALATKSAQQALSV